MNHKNSFLALLVVGMSTLHARHETEAHTSPSPSSTTTSSTSSLSHVVTSTHGVTSSSELVTMLKDISSLLGSDTNLSALATVVQQANTGVTTFDVQLIEQALQQALQVLSSSSGAMNPITILEYSGIIIETLAQIEHEKAATASTATSTLVTSTSKRY